jgi:cation diffusion facilitator CzcD-associated flavoprotein CzcO
MGVKALLIDKLPRLGDFWRSRYETVRTHTPIYTDHYPFLKFPTTWPRWLEQDKIAGWMEHYGQIMGLDYMLGTTVKSIEYDETSRLYTVEVENADGKHTFHPRHLVLATGVYAQKPIMPDIPGKDTFRGQVYHSMQHKGARHVNPSLSDKRVVIVGSGTSAHDIAQDFVNSGAKAVSIVQRHAIFSLSAKAIEEAYFSLWAQPGVSTEEADIIANSFPTAVARTFNIGQTAMMEERDKDLIEGMEKMGMQLKRAKKVGYGFIDHLIVKTGHFYIDQGAGPMIRDGRIKIHHCEEGVKEFVPDGVVLGNGKKIDADIVVLATGYHRNVLTVKELMGEKIADQVGDLGYMDSEQERIGVSSCSDFSFPSCATARKIILAD